jgi:sialate O-acetylesterase
MYHSKSERKILFYITINALIICFILSCSFAQNQDNKNKSDAYILSPIFGDNMVLQREIKVPVWGIAKPGKKVTILIRGSKKEAVADKEGNWITKIGPFSAGGPFTLTVKGEDTKTLKNILFGDVWICSGQSNMEMSVNTPWGSVLNFEEEIRNADYPEIRFFDVSHSVSSAGDNNIKTSNLKVSKSWRECSPDTVSEFSATAYFFGREIHKKKGVPIGLIRSCWSGTRIESWMSYGSLKSLSCTEKRLDSIKKLCKNLPQMKNLYPELMEKWNKSLIEKDPGLHGANRWYGPDIDTSGWKTANLPSLLEDNIIQNFDGSVWFRRKFNIPEASSVENASVSLGTVDDCDTTWVNGFRVGAMDTWFREREYKIKPDIIKSGKNTICVRVIDTGYKGGFSGEPEDMKIEYETKGKSRSISIAGKWHYKKGFDMKEIPPKPIHPDLAHHIPTVLFNGMISPLIPFGIRGVIWYQGESNTENADEYRELFPAMIKDWRKKWGQGDFPFLFVQLANYGKRQVEPVDDGWAELRDAQLKTLFLPNTGMAVAIDIGEAADIHPKNKQDVGKRLALAARKMAYGDDITYSGPVFKSLNVQNGKIHLEFDHTGGGLYVKGDKPAGFAIAGEDEKFVWAEVQVNTKEIIVWSNKVKNPAIIRYGWAMNPQCNIYNREGLPASPFRVKVTK